MKQERSTRALALFAVLAGVCCGGSPSAPAPVATPEPGLPAGTVLTFVSGEDGSPAAGVTVTADGQRYTADGAGQIVLAKRAAPSSYVDVVGPQILDRLTVLRPGETRFTLWPKSSPTGLDQHFTASIVYTSAGSAGGETGAQPLLRLPQDTRSVTIVLDPGLQGEAEVERWHRDGVERLSAANAGAIVYTLATQRPAGGLAIDARYDPENALCPQGARGVFNWQLAGYEIRGGTIIYCVPDAPRTSTVVHELGHTIGLGHSPNALEVMGPRFSPARASDYSARERLAMSLLLQRRAGNVHPDDGRSGLGLHGPRTMAIACP